MDVNTGAGAGFFSSPKGDLVFKMSDFNKFQFIELRSLESLHKGFFKRFVFNLHVCVCVCMSVYYICLSICGVRKWLLDPAELELNVVGT